jgi:hypothetical protein
MGRKGLNRDGWNGRLAKAAEIKARAVDDGDGQPWKHGGVANLSGKGAHAQPGARADGEPGGDDLPCNVARQFGAGTRAGNADLKRGAGNGLAQGERRRPRLADAPSCNAGHRDPRAVPHVGLGRTRQNPRRRANGNKGLQANGAAELATQSGGPARAKIGKAERAGDCAADAERGRGHAGAEITHVGDLVRVNVDDGIGGGCGGCGCCVCCGCCGCCAYAYTSGVLSAHGGLGTRKARVHATDGAGQGGTRVQETGARCVAHARLQGGAENAVSAVVSGGERHRGHAANQHCRHE